MDDLIIIGSSSAGTAAAIYAGRRQLKTRILAFDIGGELVRSGEIENWPGIIHTTGIELSDMFAKHVQAYGIPVETGVWVEQVEKTGEGFTIQGKKGDEPVTFAARAVIATTGVHPRELGIPGEKEYKNKGLSYCTVCDGPLFRGKKVITIGGGNSALESAIMMAGLAKEVVLVTKNPAMKGETVLIEKVRSLPNITLLTNAKTTKILGAQFVTGIEYQDATGATQTIAGNGVFVHIGVIPNSDYATGVDKTPIGEIIINQLCETNIPGFFAAGDVTNHPFRQNAIAAGQGVTALLQAANYLDRLA